MIERYCATASDAAADVLTQRLKAIEMSCGDGNWDKAQWLELLQSASATLTSREETAGANKEYQAERRWRPRPAQSDRSPPDRKGKGKGGKGKGGEAPRPAAA